MASRLAVILTLIFTLLLILLPIAFKDQPDPIENRQQQTGAAQQVPTYNLDDVTLVGHSDGQKKWELNVSGVTDQGKDLTLLNGLKNGQLFANGEAKYFFKAGSGEYNRRSDEFKLSNNVLITTTTGESIRTNEVQYNQLMQKLHSGPVEISRKDLNVRAGEMAIDVNNEIIDLSGGVEVDFTINDEDEETNASQDANVNGGGNTNAQQKPMDKTSTPGVHPGSNAQPNDQRSGSGNQGENTGG